MSSDKNLVENLQFAIDSTAPTSDQIQAERARAADLAQLASKRKGLLLMSVCALVLASLGLGQALEMFDMPQLAVGIGRSVVLLLLASAVCVVTTWAVTDKAGDLSAGAALFACGCTFFVSGLGAVNVAPAGDALNGMLLAALLAALFFAAALGVGFAHACLALRIYKPDQEGARITGDTVELSAEGTPEACVRFMDLVDSNDEIKAYHEQLLALGRMPVMAELKAAEAWASTAKERSEERQLRDQALLAAARIQGNPAAHPMGA